MLAFLKVRRAEEVVTTCHERFERLSAHLFLLRMIRPLHCQTKAFIPEDRGPRCAFHAWLLQETHPTSATALFCVKPVLCQKVFVLGNEVPSGRLFGPADKISQSLTSTTALTRVADTHRDGIPPKPDHRGMHAGSLTSGPMSTSSGDNAAAASGETLRTVEALSARKQWIQDNVKDSGVIRIGFRTPQFS